MIGKHIHNQSVIVRGFSLSANQTALKVLNFIGGYLPGFETSFKQAGLAIYKEDDISKELSRYFNDKARDENIQFQFNEKKGVDFTIYVNPYNIGSQSISMIECKRLSKTHRDYVSGETGGIERFKREQDGFGRHLDHGAIIGYIQDNNKKYWHSKVNGWIENLIEEDTDIVWVEKDKLTTVSEIWNFKSEHDRVSTVPITLFHFWISII